MSLVKFTFNAVKLQVVTIDGKEWVRAKEVCKVLEYQGQTTKVIRGHCSGENLAQVSTEWWVSYGSTWRFA